MAAQSKTGYIILTVLIEKKQDKWEANCKELGVATFADTSDEVINDIKEAVNLHIKTLMDVGEFERVLKEKKIPVTFSKPPKRINCDAPVNDNMFISYNAHAIKFCAQPAV